jgi:nitrite reductase/ring-hydroxylating ferredoxin subunit
VGNWWGTNIQTATRVTDDLNTMTWFRAIASAELSEGDLLGTVVDARHVLLSRISEVAYAVTNVCPHNGVLLSEGVAREGCISCPGHFWRFDLATGEKQGDPKTHLAVYPTRESEGWIDVDLPEPTTPRSLREILLASARGEDVTGEVAK